MIKQYQSTAGPADIDLSRVVSCKQQVYKENGKDDVPALHVRMTNGDHWNIIGVTREDFILDWSAH